jgi:hypothetical protein
MKRIIALSLSIAMLNGCTSLGQAISTAGGAAGGALAGAAVGGPAGAAVGAAVGSGVTTFAYESQEVIAPVNINNPSQAATVIAGDLFEYSLYGLIAFLLITNIVTPYAVGKQQRNLPSKREEVLVEMLGKALAGRGVTT